MSIATERSLLAVVFDLDGTLIDSVADIAAAINGVLAEEGRSPVPVSPVAGLMGDGPVELMDRAFVATGVSADPARLPALAARLLELYGGGSHDLSVLYPGVVETLAGLAARGLRFAVCTNKHEDTTRSILALLGIDHYFPVVIGGDSTGVLKPHPRILQAVLDGLGVTPSQAIMVGDSRNDMLVARRLGVPAIAAGYGYPGGDPTSFGAIAVLGAIHELPAALDRMPYQGDQW